MDNSDEHQGLLEDYDQPMKYPSKKIDLSQAMRIQMKRSFFNNPFIAFWIMLLLVMILFASSNSLGLSNTSKGQFNIPIQVDGPDYNYTTDHRSLVEQLEVLMQRKKPTIEIDEEMGLLEYLQPIGSDQAQESKQFFSFLQRTEKQIETSRIDRKRYKYIQLPNDLKVCDLHNINQILIIEDSLSPKAQAALCVHAGSWQDPNEFLGLAHFLEHMLFQGTRKYPSMGQFGEMVSKYGGSTNAYTSSVKTNYYFSVAQSGFLETLDVYWMQIEGQMFAQFFIDPLLTQEAVYKEVNAVNSEYEIDVSEDGWKFFHLLTLLSDKAHPLSRFTIGNHETLRKDGVQQALRRFFDQYYSSNLMALVVKSAISVDQMEKYLMSSDFNLITNKGLPKPSYANLKAPINRIGTLTKFRLNGATSSVIYVFQLPKGHDQFYRSKPLQLLNALIRSTHKDGIQDYIRVQNLGLKLYSSTFLDSNSAFTLLVMEFILSEHVQSRDNRLIFQLGQILFTYLNTLESRLFNPDGSPRPYYHQWFNERSSLSKVEFSFMEDATTDIFKVSNALNSYPWEEVFSANVVIKESRADLVKYYIDQLRDPSNVFILVGDDQFRYQELQWVSEVEREESLSSDLGYAGSVILNQRQPLYRLEYDNQKLSSDTLSMLGQRVNAEFQVPDINQFIPKNLALKSICNQDKHAALIEVKQVPLFFKSHEDCVRNELKFEEFLKYPMLLKHDLEGKVYWRLERSFNVPSVYVVQAIRFQTPFLAQEARKSVFLSLFNGYIDQCLSQKLFQPSQAGFKYDINADQRGFSIVFYGWSDRFEQVFTTAVREIHAQTSNHAQMSTLEQQRFAREKTYLQSSLANIHQKRMYQVLTQNILPYFTISDYISTDSQIQELNYLDVRAFEQFKSQFLQNYRFTSFFTGNIFKEESESLVKLMQRTLAGRSNKVQLEKRTYQVVSVKGRSIVVPMISQSADPIDTNGATLNFYVIGYRDEKNRAIIELLRTKFRSEAYEFLRTQHQLGYVVHAVFTSLGCLEGVYVLVQGNAETPYIVNRYIDEFLERFELYLRQMTLAEFRALKDGAVSSLKNKHKSMKEQAEYFWSEIRFGTMEFDGPEVAASIIEQITIEDVIEFYINTFKTTESGKLSLQMYGRGMVSQTLGIQSDQLADLVRLNRLSEGNSYARRDEEVIVTQQEFTSKVTRRQHCSNKIGNA